MTKGNKKATTLTAIKRTCFVKINQKIFHRKGICYCCIIFAKYLSYNREQKNSKIITQDFKYPLVHSAFCYYVCWKSDMKFPSLFQKDKKSSTKMVWYSHWFTTISLASFVLGSRKHLFVFFNGCRLGRLFIVLLLILCHIILIWKGEI